MGLYVAAQRPHIIPLYFLWPRRHPALARPCAVQDLFGERSFQLACSLRRTSSENRCSHFNQIVSCVPCFCKPELYFFSCFENYAATPWLCIARIAVFLQRCRHYVASTMLLLCNLSAISVSPNPNYPSLRLIVLRASGRFAQGDVRVLCGGGMMWPRSGHIMPPHIFMRPRRHPARARQCAVQDLFGERCYRC
jgi:hypothetical protein